MFKKKQTIFLNGVCRIEEKDMIVFMLSKLNRYSSRVFTERADGSTF